MEGASGFIVIGVTFVMCGPGQVGLDIHTSIGNAANISCKDCIRRIGNTSTLLPHAVECFIGSDIHPRQSSVSKSHLDFIGRQPGVFRNDQSGNT